MRILLFCSILFFAKTETPNHLYFEMIDFTENGALLAGISPNKLAIINTETKKIVAELKFSSRSRLVNIRISNDGKHLLWTKNMELFGADFRNNKIVNVHQIRTGRPWLDLEINTDGSKILTTSDNTKAATCSPFQRTLVQITRNENQYTYQQLQMSTEVCTYMNYCEFLPDGNILFQYQNSNIRENNQSTLSIWEAIPDGNDFGYQKIIDTKRMIPRQAVSNQGELLTYDCEYFISKKDSLGDWQTKSILPKNDYCYANWVCAIAPDGEKIVFLQNIEENGSRVQSNFLITKKVNNEWTTPQILVEEKDPYFDNVLANIRLSNTNFAYTDRNGRVMLKTSLEAAAELVEL